MIVCKKFNQNHIKYFLGNNVRPYTFRFSHQGFEQTCNFVGPLEVLDEYGISKLTRSHVGPETLKIR